MSGVYPKTREILYEAHPALAQGDAASQAARGEQNRDRVMITLLALNFLLMAFFVVLTSTGQTTRSTVVAPEAELEFSLVEDTAVRTALMEEERRRAVDVLRASVAQIFAPVIAVEDIWRMRVVERIGLDRVDIEVPFALFTDSRFAGEGDAVLEGIVRVIEAGVRGYRAELALQASHSSLDVAPLAERLVGYGLGPSTLSVGVLSRTQVVAGEETLRFTFLLLDDNDDAVVRLAGAAR